MKIKNIIYTLAGVAALTLSSSCSGFLDTPTDTRVDIKTTEQVRMLMNAAYPSVAYSWPLELMTDNLEDNNSPEGEGNQGVHYNLSSYDRGDEEMFRWEQCVSSTGADTPSNLWEGYYNSIAYCNAALEILDKWETENGKLDDTQKAIRAEAQILRAYNHFILAQIFCMPYSGEAKNKTLLGIPYVTKPEVTVKPHYERGTLAETYAMIEKDLTEALPNINNNIYEIQKYHFNTTAANAFAARYYLFTRQYEKALEYADKVFGGPDMDPTPYMSDIWTQLGNFYYVSDFGLYQNGMDKQTNFLLMPVYSLMLRKYASGYRYGVVRDALNATIHGSSPAWSSFQWTQSNGKGGSFTMHPCFNGICGTNGKSEYGYVMFGNVDEQFEYTDKIAGIGYPHHTRREFYGEETLLVRAEAKLFLGDVQGCIDDLSIWEKARRDCPSAVGYEDRFVDLTLENITTFYSSKAKYGIAKPINIDLVCPESDAKVSVDAIMPVLQCVQHFRRIETIHLGFRFLDIKRYGIEIAHKIGNNVAPMYHTMDYLTLDDPRRAVQIPAEVVAAGMQPNVRKGDVNDTVQSPDELVLISE
ncbi:MAG: RagB/SusD family nutrient uptake outer membrane protein [Bacteroidales bacterium]|nr:RagB/SusD family nutrient uptake outer membrane protein [Bacteroidales bacterium]